MASNTVYLTISVITLSLGLLSNPCEGKPNFVVLLLDDIGWGDIGIYGAPWRETPYMDKMAAEGMLFTDFYSANPVCSPSRAAMLTGRLPIRNGFYSTNANARNAYSSQMVTGGISDREILLPEILQNAGYRTKLVGKWHMGHRPEFLPLRHGFDEWFGSPNSHKGPCDNKKVPNIPVYKDAEMIGRYFEDFLIEPDGESNMTQNLIDEALEFITKEHENGRPFFLLWTPDAGHVPFYSSKSFLGFSVRGTYGDAVREQDYGVGKILDKLTELGIDQDTLVFLSADNGASTLAEDQGGSSGPFLCGKSTTYEGGVRVPAIARWPGHIEPGQVSSQLGSLMDVFVTISELAGEEIPQDRAIDGISLTPTLLLNNVTDRPIFHYRGDTLMAVRVGIYKVHYRTWVNSKRAVDKEGIDYCPGEVVKGLTTHTLKDHKNKPLLFDLGLDAGEKHIIPFDSDKYEQAMAQIQPIVDNHVAEVTPREPVLNWCDSAVQNWSPAGCEKIHSCLTAVKSDLKLCKWES